MTVAEDMVLFAIGLVAAFCIAAGVLGLLPKWRTR